MAGRNAFYGWAERFLWLGGTLFMVGRNAFYDTAVSLEMIGLPVPPCPHLPRFYWLESLNRLVWDA